MTEIEIVVFNDKSWVRLTEYQKVKEENEQLKQQIEKMKCCGNCTHRNAEGVVETCRKLKKYTLIKGSCECWEVEE